MGIQFKKSQFNYITKTNTGYLVYNTLYNSLSRLSGDEYKQYSLLEFESNDFENKLLLQGIIVNKEVDELQRYNIFSQMSSKYIKSPPSITVTPTMKCNARCFYCYENGVRSGKLRNKDIDSIIQTIRTLDVSDGISITWFGGEPLMNQEWMDAFSERLRAENIPFSSFIITNGSKIDSKVIEKMTSVWNIKSIQITFDGSITEYSKRKAYLDEDETVYYKLLKSVGRLTKSGIDVQIRLNIDKLNLVSILEVATDITQLYRDNLKVSFYPAFLTGTKNVLSEREKIDFIKLLIEIGDNFKVNEYLYKTPRTMACYYYQDNAFSIDTQGFVYTCEHMLGHKEKAIGNIQDSADLSKVERSISGQREECQKCVFLPKCHGGCFDSYVNGETPCFIDKYIIKAYLELL